MLFTSGALLEIRSGGYSLYGGLIGGCLPPFIYLHWKRLNTGAFANACAPAMALGLALTRTGCFLKGCNFGTPTDLPWGVSFPPDSHLAAHHFNCAASIPPPAILYLRNGDDGLGVIFGRLSCLLDCLGFCSFLTFVHRFANCSAAPFSYAWARRLRAFIVRATSKLRLCMAW
jgi:hypothetical protein